MLSIFSPTKQPENNSQTQVVSHTRMSASLQKNIENIHRLCTQSNLPFDLNIYPHRFELNENMSNKVDFTKIRSTCFHNFSFKSVSDKTVASYT